jgi:glycosyltransferase involved in cell wall biosynthesis
MVGRFNERLVCFHCYDDYAAYTYLSEQQRRVLVERTARLLDRADLVFAAGESMRQTLARDDVHIIPNGVDYELFAAACTSTQTPPPDMAGIPHPIVAHVGRLNTKIDYALLAEIARRRRDWSVVLIGPFTEVLAREQQALVDGLFAQPNAYHIPAKPAVELPAYLRHVDVALMAYRVFGWVVRGFPLKLFEYLAAGKPSVGSPIEENVRHRDVVTIAESPDEWIDAIEYWLANDSPELAAQRMTVARANSWDIRCRRILELIAQKLGDAPAPSAPTEAHPA